VFPLEDDAALFAVDPGEFDAQRQAMVREQIARRGIRDERVLAALRTVPRHLFVPQGQRAWAYSDGALQIAMSQTISQPYIVALMSEALALRGDENVLEVGTGSGYQAAILGCLAAQVHTIERHPSLAGDAQKVLSALEITNVHVHVGDGTLGLPENAPYQGIMVTAAAPRVPQSLLDQLDEGGRLILPVGSQYNQVLELWRRQGGRFTQEVISAVAFVPLIGAEGWDEKKWGRFR